MRGLEKPGRVRSIDVTHGSGAKLNGLHLSPLETVPMPLEGRRKRRRMNVRCTIGPRALDSMGRVVSGLHELSKATGPQQIGLTLDSESSEKFKNKGKDVTCRHLHNGSNSSQSSVGTEQ